MRLTEALHIWVWYVPGEQVGVHCVQIRLLLIVHSAVWYVSPVHGGAQVVAVTPLQKLLAGHDAHTRLVVWAHGVDSYWVLRHAGMHGPHTPSVVAVQGTTE